MSSTRDEPAGADRALALLWRNAVPPSEDAGSPRRGPKQRITVDEVVDTAIALADADGLAAVTMRSLAQRLSISAMSLYTYVPGRPELIALMADQAVGDVPLPRLSDDLRTRLATLARVEFDTYVRHAWLLEITGTRPWLGPNVCDRYEWQLSAVDGLGLGDVEMDQTVALLVGFAASCARARHAAAQTVRESGMTDAEWWEANGEALGRVMAGRDYPLASRVGMAAGVTYDAASDPARELEFGLARILDGLLNYIGSRRP